MAKEATNINQFIKQVNAEVEAFARAIPSVLQVVAEDAGALIKQRIIQRGNMASDGGEEIAFPPYSAQYQKKKARDNKPNRLVFTGNMTRSFHVLGSTIQDNKYKVTYGASNGEEQKKVNWNSDRYGDIFKITKKERIELGKTFDAELTKALKK